jgi:hypothetical protein
MKLLEIVALTEDEPDKGLRRGQVGTIVEILAPGVFKVEFSDLEGRTYALAALPDNHLMILHHERATAVA